MILKHCSQSSPSLCTAKNIRNYFQTGQLPDPGTICEPDVRPLIGSDDTKIHSWTEEDKEVMEAMRRVAESPMHFGVI